jgi:hypothetical protein
MNKTFIDDKKTPLLILGILVIVLSVAVFLLFKLYKGQPPLEISLQDVGTRQFVYNPSDTIKKYSLDNGIGYQIEGYFDGGLTENGMILEGNFVLKGDTKTRRLKTYVGNNNSTVFYGKYENSFDGTSNWTTVPQSVVFKEIKSKTPVKIEVNLILDGTDFGREYVGKKELVLDRIITEMKNGQIGEIPSDFFMVAQKVGIVTEK